MFNKKVYVSESVESSAWGAALMGMYSVGWISQLDDQSCFTETLKEFKPNVEIIWFTRNTTTCLEGFMKS